MANNMKITNNQFIYTEYFMERRKKQQEIQTMYVIFKLQNAILKKFSHVSKIC